MKFILHKILAAFLLAAVGPVWLPAKAFGQTKNFENMVFAFVGVNVIPMDKERILKNQTVIVRDGKIDGIGNVGKVKIPSGAVKIDGRGKFLMPGLVDMHLHLAPGVGANDDLTSQQMRLLLANGVTTIRNMIGHPTHPVLRDKIKRGEISGPTVYTAGPPLLGQNTPTVEAAEKAVAAQKEAGYDLLKVHEGLSPEVYAAIARKAEELNMPFAGHVTFSVGLNRALNARQNTIDHLDNYLQAAVRPDYTGEISPSQIVVGEVLKHIDEKKLTELAKATKKNGVSNNPTLTLFQLVVSDAKPEEYLKWDEMKYVPEQTRQNFAKQKEGTLNIPASTAEKQRYIELRNLLVRELYKAGATITVGPDSPQFFLVPGFATHREMQSLAEAGLPNYAVLEAATRNGAEVLGGIKEFGTIEKGKRADLLLLNANPLEDISNTKKIAGVMVRGRWLTKSDLQKMLDEVEILNREKKPEAKEVSVSSAGRRSTVFRP
jgi:imidazolonepropionase-like amidohydrolase